MSEERGFEVVDRRRTNRPPGEEPAAADVAEPDDDELFDEQDAEEMGHFDPTQLLAGLTVAGALGTTVSLLETLAWAHLGLRPQPGTTRVEADFAEARRAIDAMADILRHLQPDLSPEERRELERRLTDLRLNYVRLSTG